MFRQTFVALLCYTVSYAHLNEKHARRNNSQSSPLINHVSLSVGPIKLNSEPLPGGLFARTDHFVNKPNTNSSKSSNANFSSRKWNEIKFISFDGIVPGSSAYQAGIQKVGSAAVEGKITSPGFQPKSSQEKHASPNKPRSISRTVYPSLKTLGSKKPLRSPMAQKSAFKSFLRSLKPVNTRRPFHGKGFEANSQLVSCGSVALLLPSSFTERLPMSKVKIPYAYCEDNIEPIENGCTLPSFQTRFNRS